MKTKVTKKRKKKLPFVTPGPPVGSKPPAGFGTASVDMVSIDEGAPVDLGIATTKKKREEIAAQYPPTDPEPPADFGVASVDPWAHRSKKMSCVTCMWSVVKASLYKYSSERILGRCRRRAPTLNGYPAVWDNDWCGDHKLDENKI